MALTSRSDQNIYFTVAPGRRRGGRSKGRRVILDARDNGKLVRASIYPADARKFALELLEMADRCERDDD